MTATSAFTLTVSDVNEAPTAVALRNVTSSLAENTLTTPRVKLADIVVTDDALTGSNAISLFGPDAAHFEVAGTELFLVAGTTLDFEMKPSFEVNVAVRDPKIKGSTGVSTAFTLAIEDVNAAPH